MVDISIIFHSQFVFDRLTIAKMQFCSYINCFSSSKDKLKFFAFPSDNRRSEWLTNSGNIECNSRSRLCEKHFCVDDIYPTQLKSVLRKSAIPFNYKNFENKCVVKCEREDESKTQSENSHDCVRNAHVVYLYEYESPPEPKEIKYSETATFMAASGQYSK